MATVHQISALYPPIDMLTSFSVQRLLQNYPTVDTRSHIPADLEDVTLDMDQRHNCRRLGKSGVITVQIGSEYITSQARAHCRDQDGFFFQGFQISSEGDVPATMLVCIPMYLLQVRDSVLE